MADRRCLVPASAYYEWKKLVSNRKEKYEFRSPKRTLLYLAGIYSEDRRFAVLTREAAPTVMDIHDRMPVIVPYELTNMWLRESSGIFAEAVRKSSDVFASAVTDLQFTPAPVERCEATRNQ
jgi:putative SOS response-associated peptidase YedK